MKIFSRFLRARSVDEGAALYPEIPVFIGLLVLLNLHVIPGVGPAPQAFFPDLVAGGEWWRVLTHAFVHLSWYHLLLDGVAFLILYAALESSSPLRRLLYAGASAAGSLALALLVAPRMEELGLCGLSGAAHGLMAISGLEMISRRDGSLARIGWISLGIVCAKSIYEAISGHVFFEFLHFGMTGTPVAVSHLGGVLGGALVFVAARSLPRPRVAGSPSG